MPVFDAADAENPPLHMDGWDEDELVYLRPHVTYAMEQRAKGKAVVWPEGMTGEQLRALPQDELERLLAESTDQARVDLSIMEQMIERWSLRRAPSKAQRARGERGDLVPLTRASIEALPPAVGTFIRAEIEKRRDVVPPEARTAADGTPFRRPVETPAAGLDAEHDRAVGAADATGGGGHRADRLERRRA